MKVNIEAEYQKFLKQMKLKEREMHIVQMRETKRAFIGGFSFALLIFKNDISLINDEEEAIQCLEDIDTQIRKFWNNEVIK